MSKQKFCGVLDFPVLIPYSELENLLESARNSAKMLAEVEQLRGEVSRLRETQIEIMEKVGEIDRLL